MTQPKILANQTNAITVGSVPAEYDDLLATKRYVDAGNFINYGPKAGQSDFDSVVPVYSDFPFSLGIWHTGAATFIDNRARQVMYFASDTPTKNDRQMFRCYRYSNDQPMVFDNEPISLNFLQPSEKVWHITNLGTFYAYVRTTQRHLLVKTNGSSLWREWTAGYDVTSISTSGQFCWGLIETPSGDRIVRTLLDGTNVKFEVYDQTLTLLRTQVILTWATDFDYTDYTGQNRTRTPVNGFMYFTNDPTTSIGFPFAYNPKNGRLTITFSSFSPIATQSGSRSNAYVAPTISWNIPLMWLATGSGTPVNQITVKSGAYRYRMFPDNTWDTNTGGMTSLDLGGRIFTPTVDEYSGNLNYIYRNTFVTSQVGEYNTINASYDFKTYGENMMSSSLSSGTVNQIDGSPWSKGFSVGSINGGTAVFVGSSFEGNNWVSATYNQTAFDSVVVANDTLRLNTPTSRTGAAFTANMPQIVNQYYTPRFINMTALSNGNALKYWCRDGAPIYIETVNGSQLIYTITTVNVPILPVVVGSVTIDTAETSSFVWNGSTSSPRVWCHVQDVNTHWPYIAYWNGSGAWTIVGGRQSVTAITNGNNNRNDNQNASYATSGHAVLTASGKLIYAVHIPVIGTVDDYWNCFDTNTLTSVEGQITQFLPTGVNGAGQYQTYQTSAIDGVSFGYCSAFGYYAWNIAVDRSSVAVVSSRNIQTGTSITEQQWFDNTATRAQKFFTCQSAIGLLAYTIPYPVFLGGHYGSIPQRTVALSANATNYLYAVRASGDVTPITIEVSTMELPASFSRMLLAKIVTDATDVVTSTLYSYDGSGLPSYVNNQGKVLSNDGTQLVWVNRSGTARNATSVTPQLTDNTGSININANNSTITLPTSGNLPIGYTVAVYVGAGITGTTVSAGGSLVLRYMGTGGGATGATRSLAAGAAVELRLISANTWYLYGQGIS